MDAVCLRSTLIVVVLEVGGVEVLAEQADLGDDVASDMGAAPGWVSGEGDGVGAAIAVKLLKRTRLEPCVGVEEEPAIVAVWCHFDTKVP